MSDFKKMKHCKNKFLSPKYSPKSSNYDENIIIDYLNLAYIHRNHNACVQDNIHS